MMHWMATNWMAAITLFVAAVTGGRTFAAESVAPAWESDRTHRLLVSVDVVEMDDRSVDEGPAELIVDFESLPSKDEEGNPCRPDLATLQVMEYDSHTGQPVLFNRYEYAETPCDRPLRWYDSAIPYDFPWFQKDISDASTRFKFESRPRWGYFHEVIGGWKSGRLVWVHTVRADQTTHYAVYFNCLAKDEQPRQSAPRGWVGDGSNRCEILGTHTTGQFDNRIALDDWNNDGKIDIVLGAYLGQILVYPNIGSPQRPEFAYAKMIFMDDGRPLDVGLHGSPLVVDWDQDGNKDLLIDTLQRGRLSFFRNVGDNVNRRFVWSGFVEADGKPIESPASPCPEFSGPKGEKMKNNWDYYGQPTAVDWDGDGDIDLLIGGYMTGRIYFYENVGSNSDGTPILTFRGELEAEGKPIDTIWCAAPCAVDIDGDGDLDLIMGVWLQSTPPEGVTEGNRFLRFYRNVGSRTEPLLVEESLPILGKFPHAGNTTPAVADWDGDGDLDLIVSDTFNIWLFENVGSPTEPLFDVSAEPLRMPWGNAGWSWEAQFRDVDSDGLPDLVSGHTVQRNLGTGYPFKLSAPESLLPDGQKIDHPGGLGDNWYFAYVQDFNGDGLPDVLSGDFHGQVWFHKQLSAEGPNRFDLKGKKICTADGKPIRVGPAADAEWNFTTLQGARTRLVAADFNKDGTCDLIVTDTFGDFYYFERQSEEQPEVVKAPVLIAKGLGRGPLSVIDWDNDGWPDLLIPRPSGKDLIVMNNGVTSGERFAPPNVVERPTIPTENVETNVQMADLNGDGDADLIVSNGNQYTCFFEASFLKNGYAQGQLLRAESRPPIPAD